MRTSKKNKWDDIWMNLAKDISKLSYDNKIKVGCVIVSEDNMRVLSVGYNGDHVGGSNERDSDCDGESGFIHAEVNALIKMNYADSCKKTMYLTVSPCPVCARAIINSKVNTVIFDEEFRDMSGIDILRSSHKVSVIKYNSMLD